MRIILIFLFPFLSLFLSACFNASKAVGPDIYASRTNYESDVIYVLQKPAFLFFRESHSKEIPRLKSLGSSGTPSELDEFIKVAHEYSFYTGLMMAGERFRVVRFVDNKYHNLGNFLHVIAVVETGEFAGTTIRLDCISTTGPGPVVMIDSEYLVPLGDWGLKKGSNVENRITH